MAKHNSWRDKARPIIARILSETVGKDEATVCKALFDAYPFGERKHYPYHIWLDEIKRQRKTKRTKPKTKDGRLLVLDTKLQERLF